MTQEPEAGIVVPSYRGAERLPVLFDALAAQTPSSPTFEVVVVIDGIDDGSVALVEAERRFPVRHVLFPENRGRVAALNAGFAESRARVLIRCDDDLVPGPDYVRGHVEAHRGAPCGVVGLYLNASPASRYREVYGRHADESLRAGAYAEPSRAWRYWAGNCSLIRETWERIGPYDPRYRLYGWEDVDYGYRLHRAGIPVRLDPALETEHRVAAVTTAGRAQRAAHAGAARRLFEHLHGTAVLPPAVPPLSPWNALVRGASRVVGRDPRAWGSRVDRLLGLVPRPVATKLVALTVEAAGVAGYRAPDSAREVF